jgi:hypothetical protein
MGTLRRHSAIANQATVESMTQNTTVLTNAVSAGDVLSRSQLIVLDSLLGGATVTAASVTAGVDRSTVHRWLRVDWDFIAVMNGKRQELHDAAESRLLNLLDLALDTIEKAVASGDTRASVALLRGAGLLSGRKPAVGSDNAEHLQTESETQEQRRHARWMTR